MESSICVRVYRSLVILIMQYSVYKVPIFTYTPFINTHAIYSLLNTYTLIAFSSPPPAFFSLVSVVVLLCFIHILSR